MENWDIGLSFLGISVIQWPLSFVMISQVINTMIAKDEKSFQNIPRWIEDVKEERGDEVLIYILGNKTDLE